MRLTLSWPAAALWRNRKAHWATEKKARDAQREAAFWLATLAGSRKMPFPPHRVHLTMTFCGPTRTSRFDLDGGLTACKGAIDGIAACLGVDDSLFSYTLERGEKCKNGAVIITVEVP